MLTIEADNKNQEFYCQHVFLLYSYADILELLF